MARPPAACGTVSGFMRHQRLRERPCQPCRDARNAYQRTHKKPCTTPGCGKLEKAKGLCSGCYKYARNHGMVPATDADSRFVRLPFQPLDDFLVRRHAEDTHTGRYYGKHGTTTHAESCGVPLATYQSWRARGLTIRAADKVAVHLGTLPIFIWGDLFYADLQPEEAAAA